MQDKTNDIHKTRRNLFILGGVLFIGLLIFGVMVASDPGDNLTLSNTGIISDNSGNRFVNGLLTNNIDRSYTRVEVHFSLLDINGQQIETGKATTDIIPGEKTWEFTVPFQNEEVIDVKITSISTAEEEIRKN